MSRVTHFARVLGESVLVGVLSAVVFLAALVALGNPPSRTDDVKTASSARSGTLDADETDGLRRSIPYDETSRGVPVLCYHYLRANTTPVRFLEILGALFFNLPLLNDMDVWTQTVAAFESEMAYLKSEGYKTVDLADVVAWREGVRDLPPKTIVITFDDGDRSVVEHAYPVLEKHGFKATLFIVTSRVGQRWGRVDCLDWDELRQLSEGGVFSIQSHSHDLHRKVKTPDGDLPVFVAARSGYYDFPGASDWGEGVYEDLRTSREMIEHHVGNDVSCLAWPYGFADAALDSVAASAGYTTICTLGPGTNYRLRLSAPLRLAGIVTEKQSVDRAVGGAVWEPDSVGTAGPAFSRQTYDQRSQIRRYAITARTSHRAFRQLLADG